MIRTYCLKIPYTPITLYKDIKGGTEVKASSLLDSLYIPPKYLQAFGGDKSSLSPSFFYIIYIVYIFIRYTNDLY